MTGIKRKFGQMLEDLGHKPRELWRTINDEQDSPRRWVLRARLFLVCVALLVPVLWLLTKLDSDQRALLWRLIGFVLYAFLLVYLCQCVVVLVRRAQHRLRSQVVSAGPIRAAAWSLVKGDASIRAAWLLTVLGLATLWVGDWALLREPAFPVWAVVYIICNLFTAGALPKDRYFVGPPPPETTERKIAWVVVGVISGVILVDGFRKVQHCGCSLSEAAPLMIQSLFTSVAVFGICRMMMNYFDPLAIRRLNYGRRSKPSCAEGGEREAGSRLSPG